MWDGQVDPHEPLVLLFMYALYITIMVYNERLEKWFNRYLNKAGSSKAVVEQVSSNGIVKMEQVATTEDLVKSVSVSNESVTCDSGQGSCVRRIGSGLLSMIMKPAQVMLSLTVPDCRRHVKLYPLTFLMSILWVAVFSYIMVWMVTLIGFTVGVPDSVMGVTLLAAGASVSDTYASARVARSGHGNMAFSNCIGSNVFDILVCLSVPWFLRTVIVAPGSSIMVGNSGLVFAVALVLVTLLLSIIVLHVSHWTLGPTLGIAFLSLYSIFVLVSVAIQLAFGNSCFM